MSKMVKKDEEKPEIPKILSFETFENVEASQNWSEAITFNSKANHKHSKYFHSKMSTKNLGIMII